LKNATRRYGADRGERPRPIVVQVLQPIEAAHDVGETEIADQSLANALGLQVAQRRIFRHDLAAIGELEAAQPKALVLSFDANKYLLRKNESRVLVVPIRGVVGSAQSILAEWCGIDGMVWNAQQNRGEELYIPVISIVFLRKPETRDGSGVAI